MNALALLATASATATATRRPCIPRFQPARRHPLRADRPGWRRQVDLLGLIAGVKRLQQGELQVLGGSIRQRRHRAALYPHRLHAAGLGGNLYPELSISENIRFSPRCSACPPRMRAAHANLLRPPTCSASPSARPASCRAA
jgi:hypothetical protein